MVSWTVRSRKRRWHRSHGWGWAKEHTAETWSTLDQPILGIVSEPCCWWHHHHSPFSTVLRRTPATGREQQSTAGAAPYALQKWVCGSYERDLQHDHAMNLSGPGFHLVLRMLVLNSCTYLGGHFGYAWFFLCLGAREEEVSGRWQGSQEGGSPLIRSRGRVRCRRRRQTGLPNSVQQLCFWPSGNYQSTEALSCPTARPPYCARGYHYTYRTYVSQISQGIALYPSNLPYRSRGEGVSQLQLPSGGHRPKQGVSLRYHPNKENYQINSEKNFFGTVTGYQSPNNSRRAFCRYRYFSLPTQILGNLFLLI